MGLATSYDHSLVDLGASGAKMSQIELVNTALVESSKESGLVLSPTFQQVRL